MAARRSAIASRARALDISLNSSLATSRPSSTKAAARAASAVSAVAGTTDLDDRQPVLLRELEIALVVRRNAHHGARSILGKDVVRDPDRHALVRERMDRIGAGKDAAASPSGWCARVPTSTAGSRQTLDLGGVLVEETISSSDSTSGCSARDREKRHAVEVSSARCKDVDVRIDAVDAKANLAPSLRPIQLRCIVRVRSGQPFELIEIANRRSA